jgi:hypothetical protein
MSLTGNIHALTSEHMTMADGKPMKVPSLLDQLDKAITAETRAGSPGGGKGLPIGTGAISLLQDITTKARDEQYQRTGSDIGTLVGIIQSWAGEQNAEMVIYLEHVTLDWCDQIKAIISPCKPPWRPAVPCPSCGIIYDRDGNGPGMRVHCWGEDEAILPPGQWTAECIHCGAAWTSENMPWLARMLEVAS